MSGWRPWVAFLAMSGGMFLAILDIQIVASSLIEIQAALRIPPHRLSYLQTTYLIAEVIAIALSGWLTRVCSTRWLFTIGLIGFVVTSAACAAAPNYISQYAARFAQGLFGGVLIPLVFAAAMLMFPPQRQPIATLIAGSFAMLAPTLGPFLGGWVTETLSWEWLFLINIAPGLIAAAVVALLVRIDRPTWRAITEIDGTALLCLVVALAALELTMKEAPRLGWTTPSTLALIILLLACGTAVVFRNGRLPHPPLELGILREKSFAIGAAFSFVLGMALFGSVYLMPLYLGLVRTHGPIEIGTVMMVTGAAQLLTAPLATWLERRVPARTLTAVGYVMFAAGLLMNARATPAWDFDDLFAPQVLRGAALLLCLLPTTRLALGGLPAPLMAQGSSLFNLMRNLGGAVGLAVIDTILQSRTAGHVESLVNRLQAGDREAAAFVGLPLDRFTGVPLGEVDAATRSLVEPLVQAAALTQSLNEAWLALGVMVAAAVAALPFTTAPGGPAARDPQPGSGSTGRRD